jgi:hypothetical protein
VTSSSSPLMVELAALAIKGVAELTDPMMRAT